MDTRASSICERINGEIGEDTIFSLSGNPFQPSYTTPKILWLMENRPDVYRATYKFLQSNSYIVYMLTGKVSQDISQGYGLHVFDIKNLRYSENMCRAMGIDADKLPPVFNCSDVVGTVTSEAAKLTGISEGTPVVAGGLDAACGTLGAGVYLPGQTQEQGGQAGGMSICLDKPVGNAKLILSPHVVPGMWLLQGGTVGGGGCMRWLGGELGQPEKEIADKTGGNVYKLLDGLASSVPAGSNGVIFLPYLAGERSPIWDTNAKGVYFGLTFDKKRAHFFRSMLEGTAYALEHNLQVAEKSGVKVGTMYSMGGAANSSLWTQIKADVTGKVIRVASSDSATTLGAAVLAGIGSGVYSGFKEAVGKTVKIKREYTPDKCKHEIYMKYFKVYLDIYKQLKPVMAEHAEILKNCEEKVK